MKYLLGIDFGGGASKATLINTDGEFIAENTVEYPTLYPEIGACEQAPQDWIAALCENSKALLTKSGIDAGDILAVALDSATHTFLVCDGEYKPLRNAIHWTDTRSKEQADKLNRDFGDEIFAKTFHKPGTIWTLPQLIWLSEKEPETFAKIKYIFFEKDYIRYFLTDVFCTDYIEAEGSMLFDCNAMQWDAKLCDLSGITADMLPPVVKPTDVIGKVTSSAAKATGLSEGTPVICGTTDTVMEVFASGAVKKGQMTLKLATAGRICVITDRTYPDINLINYSHFIDGLYYPGTATKSCAASYRWFRDTFGGDYKELDAAASEVPIGCDGLVFHPYLNGELTPYANPNLCADFVGVRASHTKAHFTRAVLEGVAMSMLDCKQALDSLNVSHDSSAIIIGGGGKSPLWRQIISDALGIELIEMKYTDSSFGSAMLAGIAVGVFENAEQAVKKCNKVVSSTLPNHENTMKYNELFKKYKAIQKALEPIYNGEYL
ncbi:MAG: xylulokinase [Clostridia bacterium]|nr:xylulokinase [Clostridia bacterium]